MGKRTGFLVALLLSLLAGCSASTQNKAEADGRHARAAAEEAEASSISITVDGKTYRLSKEATEAIAARHGPALLALLCEVGGKVGEEVRAAFDNPDDVELQLLLRVLEMGGGEKATFPLLVYCIVRPAAEARAPKYHKKQGEKTELRFARVEAPASATIAITIVRQKDGRYRVAEEVDYDATTKKWVPRPGVFRREARAIRDSVREALNRMVPPDVAKEAVP